MREGDLGGLVHDVVGVEAHAAGEEALLEGPHVAAVESAREGERGERDDGRGGEEDRGATPPGARARASAITPLPRRVPTLSTATSTSAFTRRFSASGTGV